MQVELETLDNLERRLTITIPMDSIDAQIQERLKRIARTAKIQGFRPGKAPLKIVEMNYGAQVREEVLEKQANDSFYAAVEKEALSVAGYPRFDGANLEDSKFSFRATFEIYPEITIGELTEKEIEKPVCEITDADLDKTIDILRQQRARFEHVERAAENGDRVIIDFSGTIEGEPFEGGKAENVPFVLGEGKMLEAFEKGIIGMKEGEEKTVEVPFPEDYHGKEVAGKTAQFVIALKNVAQVILPELNEDFAKSLGIADGSLESMRAEIDKNVRRELKRRLQARAKENIMQALLDVCDFPIPKALTGMEAQRMAEKMHHDMKAKGVDTKNMQLPFELFTEQAERRVKLGLILRELIKANQLDATPEQVKAVVEDFSESYEDPEEVISWYYADKSRLEEPHNIATESNVVDFVFAKAKVTDTPITYEALMAANR